MTRVQYLNTLKSLILICQNKVNMESISQCLIAKYTVTLNVLCLVLLCSPPWAHTFFVCLKDDKNQEVLIYDDDYCVGHCLCTNWTC